MYLNGHIRINPFFIYESEHKNDNIIITLKIDERFKEDFDGIYNIKVYGCTVYGQKNKYQYIKPISSELYINENKITNTFSKETPYLMVCDIFNNFKLVITFNFKDIKINLDQLAVDVSADLIKFSREQALKLKHLPQYTSITKNQIIEYSFDNVHLVDQTIESL